ncbi:MAG: YncE family protein [Bacteroidales bacterium]|nr:YncE family protein [Candidatus Cryptobacteroides caccocaballi]
MRRSLAFISAIMLLCACVHEEPVIRPVQTRIEGATAFDGGFYLLNEGNMGSNKCTLDWFDGQSGIYEKNIFGYRNPRVAMELGDVGNDLKIHRERLYAVINCSNLVEVMDAGTAAHIAGIPVPNCRYICFDDDFAYVSSYAGEILSGPADRLGCVVKIDLGKMEIVGRCEVGYQPEEMVISEGRLYVANSGGYMAPDYDDRVSVIDLESFSLSGHIHVGINLHRMCLGPDGSIWVSSRGDYGSRKSSVMVVRDDAVTDTLDVRCNVMTRRGDDLIVYGYDGKNTVFSSVDMRTMEISEGFIKDGSESRIRTPYGLAANPHTGEILITDATDYVTPGKLICYSPDGRKLWSVTTGDIPSSIAFY